MSDTSDMLGFATSVMVPVVQGAMSSKEAKRAFKYNMRAYEQQNKYNRELAAYQNQLNIAQWNRENAYNDPTAQMERLAKAGLNPNLVYGGGATTLSAKSPTLYSGNSAQRPTMETYHGDFGVGQASQNLLALLNLRYDSELKKENANYLRSQANLVKTKQMTESIEQLQKSLNFHKDSRLFQTSIDAALANLRQTLASTDETKQRIAESKYRMESMRRQWNLTDAQINLSKSQLLTESVRRGLISQQQKTELERTRLTSANADSADVQADLLQGTYMDQLAAIRAAYKKQIIDKDQAAFLLRDMQRNNNLPSTGLVGAFWRVLDAALY